MGLPAAADACNPKMWEKSESRKRRGMETSAQCGRCNAMEMSDERFQVCRRCRDKRYCSLTCSIADWPEHRVHCTPLKGHGSGSDGAYCDSGCVALARKAPDSLRVDWNERSVKSPRVYGRAGGTRVKKSVAAPPRG